MEAFSRYQNDDTWRCTECGFAASVSWSFGSDMTTKADLLVFVLRVADGIYTKEDWQRYAIAHYTDQTMEIARKKTVRYVLGYPSPSEESHPSLRELLAAISKIQWQSLQTTDDPSDFYANMY